MSASDTNISKQSNEQRYYDMLNRICRDYHTTGQARRFVNSGDACTDSYESYLEMAYQNIQADAFHAIKGRRRPKA